MAADSTSRSNGRPGTRKQDAANWAAGHAPEQRQPRARRRGLAFHRRHSEYGQLAQPTAKALGGMSAVEKLGDQPSWDSLVAELPGMGEVLAKRAKAERTQRGGFSSVQELSQR